MGMGAGRGGERGSGMQMRMGKGEDAERAERREGRERLEWQKGNNKEGGSLALTHLPQNAELDRGTLSICISLIENGVNPEALAVS